MMPKNAGYQMCLTISPGKDAQNKPAPMLAAARPIPTACRLPREERAMHCPWGTLDMVAALVPDTLWGLIEPFLPMPLPKAQGGRPRLADRVYLAGIIFVLRTGVPWQMLPKRLGCGSGMTCWRRLRDWQQNGIWDLIHFALLDCLSRDGQIDWSHAVVDSCSVRAVFGGC